MANSRTLPVKSPTQSSLPPRRTVVVHSGARDAYQVARALQEAGMLDTLVTDLFWPSEQPWARKLAAYLPASLREMLRQRCESHLPSQHVHSCVASGLRTLLLEKIPHVPMSWRRGSMRRTDAALGRFAGELAERNRSALLSYSYYGFDAFTRFTGSGTLFQLHPHPLSMRRILRQELADHPDCAASLEQEWELALPEQDFERLVRETSMASRILVASSFTRQTLIEQGVAAADITVIPYGVDCRRFKPRDAAEAESRKPLQLLFVGRINQRKGIKYLLEALRLLNTEDVHLTVCGRVVDGLELFKPFASQVTVRPSVSEEALVAAYQSADLFVFPSVAEGFGQVLLEALASGLPVLSTTHTAAPDLIEEGVQGFVVEPRRPDLLAERINWALHHRSELREMRKRARERAECFTWSRFRSGIVTAMQTSDVLRERCAYV